MRMLLDGQVADDDGDSDAYLQFLEAQFAEEARARPRSVGGSAVGGLYQNRFRSIGGTGLYDPSVEPPFHSR